MKLYLYLLLLPLIIHINVESVLALGTFQQTDPAKMCAEGIRLYSDNPDLAKFFLKAGFEGHNARNFANQTDLGICALMYSNFVENLEQKVAILEVARTALEANNSSSEASQPLALTWDKLGQTYQALGHKEDARYAYREASKTVFGLGSQRKREIGKVLDLFKQAQRTANLGIQRLVEGNALYNIGWINQYMLNQPEEALRAYEQAQAAYQDIVTQILAYPNEPVLNVLCDTAEARSFEGKALYNIGEIFSHKEQYGAALSSFQLALDTFQGVNNQLVVYKALREINIGSNLSCGVQDNDIDIVESLNKLGETYYHLGRLEESEGKYSEALTDLEDKADYELENLVLIGLSLVYDQQERWNEAEARLHQALEIASNEEDKGLIYHNLGAVYTDKGEYDLAEQYLHDALEIFVNNNWSVGVAHSSSKLAKIYQKTNRKSLALETYPKTIAQFLANNDSTSAATDMAEFGFLLQDSGQLELAIRNYESAMSLFETVRSAAGSDLGRVSYTEQYAKIYDRAVDSYHQLNQDRQAFYISERGRARTFLEALSSGQARLQDTVADGLLVGVRRIYDQTRALETKIIMAVVTRQPSIKINLWLIQLKMLDQQKKQLITKINTENERLAALVKDVEILDVKGTQELLDKETTLLSYYVLDDQTLAFILTRDNFKVIELNVSQTNLVEQIKVLTRFSLPDIAYPPGATELYEMLIAPLKNELRTVKLVIVPNDVLHYVPFAALNDGNRFLIDDYTLTRIPSATALQLIQPNIGHALENPLILGNPVITSTLTNKLPALLSAEVEVEEIGRIYNTNPFIGKAATESLLKTQSSQAGIIHLAAHSRFLIEDVYGSDILLSPDEINDGRLTAAEIYSLTLEKTGLVVLSACTTQTNLLSEGNAVTAGDELVGLTNGFFIAGTPSVVATLWPIYDDPTREFMTIFYGYVRQGLSKAEALRQTQLNIREQYPGPYYWAGFILAGDGG